ncbi:MAG: radical SAM protein [Candidatus Altiarchaeota archaeon]
MNVTFINPPVDLERLYGTGYLGSRGEQPPLGLCYLAAVLEEDGNDVRIIDAEFEGLNTGEITSHVVKHNTDIVGLTCVAATFYTTLEIAKSIRESDDDIKIIIGGPFISANPEEVISNECFDFGVIGEGEETMLELVDAIEGNGDLRRVDGILFRENGNVVKTHARRIIEDLDSLPFPARHLLPDIRRYIPESKNYRRLPSTTMVTSRGCPYNCIYCDQSVFGRKYRQNSAERVVDEMESLARDYGAREIFFTEDTFTLDNKRIGQICELINERGIDLAWRCCTRSDLVTKDLLVKMKDAGMWHIFYGAESGCQRILDTLKKGFTLDDTRKAIEWSDQAGLYTQACFMINNPSETHESIEETIRFAKSLPLTELSVLMMTPLPNTRLYETYKRYGTFDNTDLTQLNSWQPVFIPEGLTREYLIKRRKEFYREFFLRPKTIFRNLRQIRGWVDVKRYAGRFGAVKAIMN